MPGRREENRAAVLDDIRRVAREHLATDGAAALSLRSVARDLGMVSSGIYRYIASRDELLTMLVASSYSDLADAIEAAVGGKAEPATRWRNGCRAVRAFALSRPHEYALLYGTPVPGYDAPLDTIGPATRVYAALAAPLSGHASADTSPVPTVLRAEATAMIAGLPVDVNEATALRFLGAIGAVFGAISLELFGHMNNVITDRDAFFDWTVRAIGVDLGL